MKSSTFYRLALFVILLLLFSAYSNSFYSPPVLDDFHSFVDDPELQARHNPLEYLSSYKSIFGLARVVPMITFAWDLWIGNGDLFYLHLTNFLIHILCFLSVLLTTYLILISAKSNSQSKEFYLSESSVSLWVAAFWALNPVQTGAVTYLVQRMASLATLFFVLSIATYIAGRLFHAKRGNLCQKVILLYLCSFLTAVLAFVSKQNTATIPAMILITEIWFFQPSLTWKMWEFSKRHWVLTISISTIGLGILGTYLYHHCPIAAPPPYRGGIS